MWGLIRNSLCFFLHLQSSLVKSNISFCHLAYLTVFPLSLLIPSPITDFMVSSILMARQFLQILFCSLFLGALGYNPLDFLRHCLHKFELWSHDLALFPPFLLRLLFPFSWTVINLYSRVDIRGTYVEYLLLVEIAGVLKGLSGYRYIQTCTEPVDDAPLYGRGWFSSGELVQWCGPVLLPVFIMFVYLLW